jgi:c(7)-type cytochrome triheme protein
VKPGGGRAGLSSAAEGKQEELTAMSKGEGRKSESGLGRGGVRSLSLAALVAGCLALAFVVAQGLRATASANAPAVGFLRVGPASQGDYGNFSHGTPRHAQLACDSCHQRTDNSPRPQLPGHRACTDCHVPQFMTAGTPFCGICHTSVDSRNPAVKGFPPLRSFNVRFDHAQHSNGAGRPAAGCASCHAPSRRSAALPIPAGLDAHANCYQCHTPGANAGGRDLGSCGACHAPGGYRRTPAAARAFRVGFSHAAHGPRQGLNCAECHTVRAGAAQGRQVSAPQPVQHSGSPRAQTCMTCHNNRRAFGGDDFADCKRCHKGQTFRF